MISRNRITGDKAEVVELIGLYWHFVDIVWIVIFTLVYLIPAMRPHEPLTDHDACHDGRSTRRTGGRSCSSPRGTTRATDKQYVADRLDPHGDHGGRGDAQLLRRRLDLPARAARS